MNESSIWKYLVVFAIIALLLAGCASAPVKDISLYSEADPKANFSGYKSYTWMGSVAIVNDALGAWEPPSFDVDMDVKFFIDRELRKRGLSENSYDPDLFVAFALGVDMDAMDLEVDPETEVEMLDDIPKSGLVIILVDSQTDFVIWVGIAEADVQENPTDETIKARLDYAVTRLLKRIPK